MVLPFTPAGNETSRCAGIDEYQARRPPMSSTLHDANLAIFILAITVYCLTLIWVWVWRDKPRFHKVRPFSLSFFLIAGFATYNFAAYLSPIYPLPCALVFFCYIIALAWFACVVMLRAVALTVETQYMTLAKREQNLFLHNNEGDVASSHASASGSAAGLSSTVWTLMKVSMGCANIDDLNLSELAMTRKSYVILFAIITIPACLVFVIVVAAVPEFQGCYNCEAFLEVPIAFTAAISIYSVLSLRAALVAYRLTGFDNKGVIIELLIIPLVVGTLAVGVWGLIIADPGDIAYNREFNWSLFFAGTNVIFWINCFGYQLFRQWRDYRGIQRLQIVDRRALCKSEPALKKDFLEFASRQFVTESLQFLEDIETFKQFYFEKGDTWRASKFKSLVETYILPGAKMEINISHAIRSKIIQQYEQLKASAKSLHLPKEYVDSFDAAYKELEQMIDRGIWTEFLIKRAKQHKPVQGGSNPPRSVVSVAIASSGEH